MLRPFHTLPLALLAVLAAAPTPAQEPRREASVQVVGTYFSDFDEAGIGLGLGLGYRLTGWFAFDASLARDPSDLGGAVAFSGSRTEFLLGVRLGPKLAGSGPYAAARAGLLKFGEAPEPFPCIAIFPPPLTCTLGAGETVGAVQLGLGYQLGGERGFFRIEAGDLGVRYPGPTIDPSGAVREDHHWGHDFRASVAAGLRF